MVVAGTAALRENPNADEDFIKDYMRGNYCRCTGYHAIVKAILAAGERVRNGEKA